MELSICFLYRLNTSKYRDYYKYMLKINKKIMASFLCIGIVLVAFVWLFKPSGNSENIQNTTQIGTLDQPSTLNGVNTNTEKTLQGKTLPTLSSSLAGSEIDCPLQVDAKGQLVLTKGIRDCFDYFFSTIGEKTEGQIILDIKQYLTATLPTTAAPYAISLLKKYIDYKKSLAAYQNEQKIKVDDSKTYAQVLNAMSSLQQKYFSLPEIQALFGFENVFNLFTVEQLKINENKQLSSTQKAEKMAALIDELPAPIAEGIKANVQFNELQQLTKEIQDRGGSPSEIRAMREKLVGIEATNRLEQVDSDEANWHTKVNQYLVQRDQINNSGMSATGKQQAIDAIRQSTFNTNEEQLRSQTYEQIHDSKSK